MSILRGSTVFTSKCLNLVFQCANCLILDAYFGGKVKFIWSEKILVKVKILKKIFRHLALFSGQALTIYYKKRYSWKKKLVTLSIDFLVKDFLH